MDIESDIESIDVEPEVAFRDIMALLSTSAMGKELDSGLKAFATPYLSGVNVIDIYGQVLGVEFSFEPIDGFMGITFPLVMLEVISSSYIFALQQLWGVDSTGVLEVLYSIYDEQPGISTGEVLHLLAGGIAIVGTFIGTLGLGTPALVAFAILAGGVGLASTLYDASKGDADGSDIFKSGLASLVGVLLAFGPGVGTALASKLTAISQSANSAQAQRILSSIATIAGNSAFQRATAWSGLAIASQDDINDVALGIATLQELHPSLSDEDAFKLLQELAISKQKLEDLVIEIESSQIQPIPAEPTHASGQERERERLHNWLALHKDEPVLLRITTAASGFDTTGELVIPPSIRQYLINWGQLVGQTQHMGGDLPFDPGVRPLTGSQVLTLMQEFPDFDFTQNT